MSPGAPGNRLEAFFAFGQRGTSWRTEVAAGATTFVTMAYILFVNPAILGSVPDPSGRVLDRAALLTSTALVSAAASLTMGLASNLPLALAPGMGLNSVVAYQLVAGMGLTWPEAMGVIVAEGVVITLLVATGLRQAVVRAVPVSQKRAIGIGIGLFLAFIGLVSAGVVTRPPGGPVPVQLGTGGRLVGFPMLLFVFALLLTALLVARRVPGALLIGMGAATAVAIAADGLVPGATQLPHAIFSAPNFAQVGQFSFRFVSVLGLAPAALVVFSVMLSDFFDTVGTVMAVGQEARYLDAQGSFPRPGAVLLVDSLAAAAGGAVGASSATTYVESAAGAAAGGRTGLTAVVCGLLFALCLGFAPLAGVVPPQATGAVLVLVGFFMMRDVGSIPWQDATEAIPAFLTLAVMPFTYSITNGIGAGFVSYTALKLLRGRWREVHPLLAASAVAFLAYFVGGRG